MERKVKELSIERDYLLKQIEKEDKIKSNINNPEEKVQTVKSSESVERLKPILKQI